MSHAQDLVLAAIQQNPGIAKMELDRLLDMDSGRKLKALCRDRLIIRKDVYYHKQGGRTFRCVYYAMPEQ